MSNDVPAAALPTDSMPPPPPEAAGALILNQYLADFSIENPGGRVSDEEAAQLQLDLKAAVRVTPGAAANQFNIDIAVGMPARLEERIIFLIELRYRLSVQVVGLTPAEVPSLLYVQIPTATLPLLREIVEKNGAFAGYPELSLHGIDFAALYQEQLQPTA